MVAIFDKLRDFFSPHSYEKLRVGAWDGQVIEAPVHTSIWDGEAYPGGLGAVDLFTHDYYTMRKRSTELFAKNKFASGLIERYVSSMVNTGIMLEATPEPSILGIDPETLGDWSDKTEAYFAAWASTKYACDYLKEKTLYEIQEQALREGLIEGDVLVVLRFIRGTNLPAVQLVSGSAIQSPTESPRSGNKIRYGVETNPAGREVAYWIRQEDGTFTRMPAYGSRSGMRIAWLYSPLPKRKDEARAQPMLTRLFQDLYDLNKYRDAALRQAVLSAVYVAWITRNSDKPGSLPLQGSAIKRKDATLPAQATDEAPRRMALTKHLPGAFIDYLGEGEDIKMRGSEGADINYGAFEDAIVRTMAWSLGIPPEIMQLSFSSNYSASQAASAEYRALIGKFWVNFGSQFNGYIYETWLIREVDNRVISAPGLVESYNDPQQYAIASGWLSAEWYGNVKPSLDLNKQVKGSAGAIELGLSTHAREARIVTGTKYTKNIRTLIREQQQILELERLKAQTAQVAQPTSNNNLEVVPDGNANQQG